MARTGPVPIIDSQVFIESVRTSLPKKSITQEASVERMREYCVGTRAQRLARHIGRQSGVRKRYLAALDWQDDPDRTPLFLPAADQPNGPGMGPRNRAFDVAADDLLRKMSASITDEELAEIATLVTVSCTHASSPGLEKPLFDHTTLSPGVFRWNLGFMGCSAGLAALRLVHGLRPQQQRALICTCELSSLHFQYTEEVDQITANLLFADGAAIVSLTPRPSNIAVKGCRSVHLPSAADQMTWFADDNGLRLRLSRDLPDTLAQSLKTVVDDFLQDCGYARSEVDHWIVHPGGPQILDSVESTLDLGPGRLSDSRHILAEFGNMSSSTVFFILQRFIERRASGLGVALAFGPGLTIELVLLEFDPARS